MSAGLHRRLFTFGTDGRVQERRNDALSIAVSGPEDSFDTCLPLEGTTLELHAAMTAACRGNWETSAEVAVLEHLVYLQMQAKKKSGRRHVLHRSSVLSLGKV